MVGRTSTVVTEVVYRKQLRPVIQSGATVVDQLFTSRGNQSGNQGAPTPESPAPSRKEPGSDQGIWGWA